MWIAFVRQRISSTSFMPSMSPDFVPSFARTQSGTAHGVSSERAEGLSCKTVMFGMFWTLVPCIKSHASAGHMVVYVAGQ